VALGLGDGDGLAEGVAGADVGGYFKLVVELGGGGEGWGGVVGAFELAAGAEDFCTANDERGRAAVVADGDPLVVGEEGLVGAEELADVGGVMDGGVEVGVVLDGYRLEEDGVRHGEHQRGDEALLVGVAFGAVLNGFEEVEEALAERRPGARTAAHEGVELRGGAGGLEVGGECGEEIGYG
jgi:hypothetical protein